jgi:dimethylglycine dehydrogenase
MKIHTRVLVIGGGILGCSLLYRLTRMGWTDVVLVEKTELTAGTTWHSTGLTALIVDSVAVSKLNALSLSLYDTLEEETGQPTGLRKPGAMRLAKDSETMARYTSDTAKARILDIDYQLIGPKKVGRLFPLMVLDGIHGACYEPEGGYIDAAMATQAFAKGARDNGAKIYRQTQVTGLEQKRAGDWRVTTDKGTIDAEIVVNATGFWAPEIAAMAGFSLPIIPMERQYLITDTIPEVKVRDVELPVVRDDSWPFYFKQEGDGFLFGVHEAGTPFCFENGIPPDFGQELLPHDLERGAKHIQAGMDRVPVFAKVGIKSVVCGPTSRTTDMNGLMGPLAGLRNFFVLAGFSSGVSQGAGVGQQLAEWIVEGAPSLDLHELDVNRYGAFANRRYVRAMLVEKHSIGSIDPTVEREAGRPAKTGPLYHRLKDRGAEFGARYGWECPLSFGPVARECRAVRQRAAIMDRSAISMFEITGPDAQAFLDRLCTNALPERGSVIAQSPMLTERGTIQCLMTVARLGPDRFRLSGPVEAERHHFAWLSANASEGDGVTIENLTGRCAALLIAGPAASGILSNLTRTEFTDNAFPPDSVREIDLGYAPVIALRLDDLGVPAWEIHMSVEYQAALYDALIDSGTDAGIADFGLHAFESLRLEAGIPSWGRELTTETSPLQAGLGHLVDMKKGDFIGRGAVAKERRSANRRRLARLMIDAKDAVAGIGEGILDGENVAGLVTSAGYGHTVGKSIVFTYLAPKLAEPGTVLAVKINGRRRRAVVAVPPAQR